MSPPTHQHYTRGKGKEKRGPPVSTKGVLYNVQGPKKVQRKAGIQKSVKQKTSTSTSRSTASSTATPTATAVALSSIRYE